MEMRKLILSLVLITLTCSFANAQYSNAKKIYWKVDSVSVMDGPPIKEDNLFIKDNLLNGHLEFSGGDKFKLRMVEEISRTETDEYKSYRQKFYFKGNYVWATTKYFKETKTGVLVLDTNKVTTTLFMSVVAIKH